MFSFRYFRLFVNLYSFWIYRPVERPAVPTLHPNDVTVIIPTASDSSDNKDLEECLATCFANKPSKIAVVTAEQTQVEGVKKVLLAVREAIQTGSSAFLKDTRIDLSGVEAEVMSADIRNKRQEMIHGISRVSTSLILFVDDHVFLPRKFLDAVVPVFENPRVGLCGTKKDVRRQRPQADTFWGRYWESFWNVMGILYLHRHNFEVRATNALDGEFLSSPVEPP